MYKTATSIQIALVLNHYERIQIELSNNSLRSDVILF